MIEYTEDILKVIEAHGDKMEEVMMAGRIPVNIFTFRRHKHDFKEGWEIKYLNELINTLKEGMKVFDIGAENGEFTAMAAKIVGCGNVHIFEPSKFYWHNIKRLWGANGFEKVGGCFDGFVSDNNSNEPFYFGWPEMYEEIFYCTYHSVESSKEISIDNYCGLTNVYPDVIMMDIEGGELSVIRGALETMNNHSPIFFISVHNDELMARSGGTKEDLFKLFREHQYSMMHIDTDHEEHWKFYKE